MQAFQTGVHDELNGLKGTEAQIALDVMQEVGFFMLRVRIC